MMTEHDIEGERYRHIEHLTNGYTAPEDACNSYRLVLQQLKAFEEALHQHIHLENNIVFPRSIKMEAKLRRTANDTNQNQNGYMKNPMQQTATVYWWTGCGLAA
mgnify:CR=1 FL=1